MIFFTKVNWEIFLEDIDKNLKKKKLQPSTC